MQKKRVPEAVERVRRQFDDWRSVKERRDRIPERLWDAAVDAARRHGVNAVCRVARLEHAKLSRRVQATAIKILVYDGQGFWLCQKRLSKGRFQWWPACAEASAGRPESAVAAVNALDARDLQLLLWNGDPSQGAMKPLWRGLRMEF